MTREHSREDAQEELRVVISDVLRQQVTEFSLSVRSDLREEFRHFLEELRSNGHLGVGPYSRSPRPADYSFRSASRPPSASKLSPPSANNIPSAPSSQRNGPPSTLRQASTSKLEDQGQAPVLHQSEDSENSPAMRITSSAFMTEKMERLSHTSKTSPFRRIFSRGSDASHVSRVAHDSESHTPDYSSESSAHGASKAATQQIFDAPKPAALTMHVQPPEQGPPMMINAGEGMTAPGTVDLGPLTECEEEIAGPAFGKTKSNKTVRLCTRDLVVNRRADSYQDLCEATDSEDGSEVMAIHAHDEEQNGDHRGSTEVAWQQAVSQVSSISFPERSQKMALARARAASAYRERTSLNTEDTEMTEAVMGMGSQVSAQRSMLSRAKTKDIESDGRGGARELRRSETLWTRAKRNLKAKLRITNWGGADTEGEMGEDPNAMGATGRHALRTQNTSAMVLRPRVGSIYSDGLLDFGTGRKKWRCSKCIAWVVSSEVFDYFMGVFLVANAISIGVQVDHMAHASSRQVPLTYRILETAFCVVFLTELMLRVFVYRSQFFRMKGWQWNMFDSAVVGFQILDEITKYFLTGTEVQGVIDDMGVLRMLRLGRIVRLVRMVRLIPELKSMVYLISASMWSFFWTVVLLVLQMYCFAVYYTEVATDIGWEADLDVKAGEGIRAHWGSVSRSILSLYKAITGGDDWVNFVVVFDIPVANYTMNTLVFCLYMAFAVMVMLNLVTGVFVEGAQRIIREDKDSELIKQVRKLFQLADSDNSNEITWEEFKAQMDQRAMDEYFKAVDLSRKEAKDLFKLLDVDHSGSISVEEFVKGCLRLRGPARSVDLAALVYDMNLKHSSIKSDQTYVETQLNTIAEQVGRTCAFLDSCASAAGWDHDREVGENGAYEPDGILV